jgi:hypothetical protein
MSVAESRVQPAEDLPYRIELWREAEGEDGGIERVLARAASMQLAQAIFRASREEHPKRRITLREGDRILADTAR